MLALEHHSTVALWEELKQEQGRTPGTDRFWTKAFVSQSEGPILPQHCPCQQPIRSPRLVHQDVRCFCGFELEH